MTERFGPYELHALLGRGGMGEVFRASDTRKNRGEIALKRLPAGLADDTDFHRRFLREAELAARLRDPHVIPIHDYGDIDGQPFLDMRLVDGTDLADELRERGPLDPARAVDIVTQVAAALDAAHAEHLVHRDVKPQNVLLSRPGGTDTADFAYLIDFGIAANLLTSRRSSALVSGTAAYMAPERFTAGGDHRVDVYALGCMLHELLTGSTPYSGDFMQLMWAHARATPPRPSVARTGVPASFDHVVATAVAKDPDARYATAGALATAARDAVPAVRPPSRPKASPQGPPKPAMPRPADAAEPTAVRRAPRWWQRRAVVMPTVIALLVAGAGLVWSAEQGRPLLVSGGADAVATAPDGRHAYVVGTHPRTLSVVDTSSNKIVAAAQLGPTPPPDPDAYDEPAAPENSAVAVTPDGRDALVTDRATNTVTVVLTATATVVGTVNVLAPTAVAVSPDGTRAWVAETAHGALAGVAVIDLGRRVVVATVPGDTSKVGGEGIAGIALSPDGRRGYATDPVQPGVVVIDTATATVSATVTGLGSAGSGIAVSPDGRQLYVTGEPGDLSHISVIDTTTGTGLGSVGAVSPQKVVVAPDGRAVYAITATPYQWTSSSTTPPDTSDLLVIDPATDRVERTISVPSSGATDLALAGDRAVVTCKGYLATVDL